MSSEKLLTNNIKLLSKAHRTFPRVCFMCFSTLPSKKAFGKTNLFRLMACDECYKNQYKENS